MPLRPARVGRVGVIGAPVAKTAVVAAAVTPGPSPVAKTAVVAAAVTPGRGGSPADLAHLTVSHRDKGMTDRACTRRPADPGQAVRRDPSLRREGSGRRVSADRAAAAAGGRPERARHPARRRRLRRVERVRRAVRDADGRAAGRERPEVQPLPHDGAVRPDAGRAADRPQPPHGRDGGHHRARHLGARATTPSAPTRARRWRRRCS